jgi:alcohol dehydrogenase class IV
MWVTSSVQSRVAKELPWPISPPELSSLGERDWLIAAGGGALLDFAKAARLERSGLRLVLLPTIWGSGAEASPIIVSSHSGRKEIRIEPTAVPDAIVFWPDLGDTISPERQRAACGDCWAHALEGFLSPLATPELRSDLADLLRELMRLRTGSEPEWFTLSAKACAGQARSSVGLVHGIAHSLEAPLLRTQPGFGWHHARLCNAFLFPVMHLNRNVSPQFSKRMSGSQLEESAILGRLRELWCEPDYRAALPTLREEWANVLRNPCSRTNCALVRPDWLSQFEQFRCS